MYRPLGHEELKIGMLVRCKLTKDSLYEPKNEPVYTQSMLSRFGGLWCLITHINNERFTKTVNVRFDDPVLNSRPQRFLWGSHMFENFDKKSLIKGYKKVGDLI